MKVFALSGLALALAMLGSQASAWELDKGALAVLQRGQAWAEVQPDKAGASGRIRAAVDIEATPQVVWRVMTDCQYAQKMVGNVSSCRILDKDPAGRWDVREHVTAASPLVPQIRNVFRSDYTPYSRITFGRVSGDLRVMQGEWRLVALDGGKSTRVLYENRVAARILAPSAVVRFGLRADTPKVLMNLKRLVLSGA